MGEFEVARAIDVPVETVWRVVTDFPRYARWMPLTRIRTDPGPVGVGWSFAGLTGVGPLRFADPMTLTEWDPPHGFAVVKTGRLLAGWARVGLEPQEGGTRLLWREDITVRPTPVGRRLSGPTDLGNRLLFGRVVDAMAREAVARG